ncbi:hypothetical protein LPJ64_001228 [Coemansia asiatica]|uniref:Uncharacterized protein n=1 Tax=Coemansia asiatica TaxID=1052880 RepID=A0A9W7XLP5_9FUNG|nr:hypothetical protein LPJ64_001228 [Coemansia asiatica]
MSSTPAFRIGTVSTNSSSNNNNGGSRGGGRRRNLLGRAVFHKEKHSSAFPVLHSSNTLLSPAKAQQQQALLDQHTADTQDFFGEKAGRSSSCCEPRGFIMKRPSCCSDYFGAAVGPRATEDDARVPLFRTHSMSEIQDFQNAGQAPASEPMAVYYNKMARLSPMASRKDKPKQAGALRVPAPDPIFLRRLGTRSSDPSQPIDAAGKLAGNAAGTADPVSVRCEDEAVVPADNQSQVPLGPLSKLTLRLVGGFPFVSEPAASGASEVQAADDDEHHEPSLRYMALASPEESISTFVSHSNSSSSSSK